MTRAVFLWHMHQPEYRDPVSGQPLLPWVRLHATRAYTDMAAALEKHDKVRVVANWAPSLLLQLEAYAGGTSVDKDEALARKPVADLTTAERAHVVKESFSVDWELWVKPVPRYAELLAKRGADLRKIDLLQTQAAFTDQELLDLEVHFMLGWMGFAARREEPLVAELVRKERGFAHAEKVQLLDLSRRIAQRLLPRWRKLEGQVEITCSPMYHPILPLLVDTDSARRAMPQVELPPRFQHPEDAREQVKRGLDRAERDFGARPVGMWPSEGSVSPEVIEVLASQGVRWCATDQGNLERSELAEKPAGPLHHRPWLCGEVAMFFRDRELSDMIGFRYARSEPQSGAQDLLKRIAAAGDATITLALDGENPWEHYPSSGELFLEALYEGLESGPVASVLPRERPAPRGAHREGPQRVLDRGELPHLDRPPRGQPRLDAARRGARASSHEAGRESTPACREARDSAPRRPRAATGSGGTATTSAPRAPPSSTRSSASYVSRPSACSAGSRRSAWRPTSRRTRMRAARPVPVREPGG